MKAREGRGAHLRLSIVFIKSFARSIAAGLSGDDDFAHVCISVLKVTMVGLSPASMSILKSLNPLSTPKAVQPEKSHVKQAK